MSIFVIGATDPPAVSKHLAACSGVLAFDIGANCGQSVERLLPNFDRVVAVEPAEESYDVLRDNWNDDARVTLHHAACTDHEGPVVLEVRDIISTGQLTTGPAGNLPWGDRKATREVPGITVDKLSAEHGWPDMVKVDTEGHETLVLQGAGDTLARHPSLLIEIHSARNGVDCRELLDAAGYVEVRVIPHHAYKPGSWGTRNHFWLVA